MIIQEKDQETIKLGGPRELRKGGFEKVAGVYKRERWGQVWVSGNMGELGSAIHPLVRGTIFCLTTPRG